jgi:CO/xanthine dehydrogenase FAD-binding subunit
MYATAFDYVRASSWAEAVDRLEQLGEDAHVIAGGQSLVPMMMLRMATPTALVDVGGASERTIEVSDGVLELSALVRHVDLEHSDTVAAACPMLTEAVRHIGNVRVRQRGTIGGSLAHAEATSELACVTLAHRGSVRVLGPGGERTVDASDLFITHLMTTLDHAEVITAVRLPALTGRQGSCFVEMARRAGDFAMVEMAAIVELDGDDRCAAARLVVGAVGDKAVDVSDAAQELVGESLTDAATDRVGRAVADDVEIGPSSHAGVDYRREMVAVLAGRALREAARRAAGGHADSNGHRP